MEELTTGVSWTGVIVGAVAAFIWGWIWYAPRVFGNTWAKAHKVEIGTAASIPVRAMILQVIALFLVSWFVGVTAVSNALATAILALVGFTLFYDAGAHMAKVPSRGILVNVGYWVTSFVIMIIAQGIF